MSSISDNIREIMEQVRHASARVNRDPAEIGIVAVTKTVPVSRIKEAVMLGCKVLGENRVQELTGKYPMLEGVEWHLIGHLQTNKVKYIVDKVALIHSLDSLSLALEISRKMTDLEKVMDVLVQVNVADDEAKYGIRPEDTGSFIDAVRKLPGLKIKGLMTIGPYVTDPEDIRGTFRRLRMISEEMKTIGFPGVEMRHLSMGMSNDYIVAIEEGATLIRVGSIIFGQRN